MVIIMERTVDEGGRLLVPQMFYADLGITQGVKTKVYLYCGEETASVCSQEFLKSHLPENLMGIQIIEATVDKYGRLTIRKKCREILGIKAKDKICCNKESGLMNVWNPNRIRHIGEIPVKASRREPTFYACSLKFRKIEPLCN